MPRKGLNLEEELCYFEELPSDDESVVSDVDSQGSSDNENEEYIRSSIPENRSRSSSEIESDNDDDVDDPNAPSTSRATVVRCRRGISVKRENSEFLEESGPSEEMKNLDEKSPIEIFLKIFMISFLESIIFQTNLYAMQDGKPFQPLQMHEMLKFLGINLLMGVKRMPSDRDYWSTAAELHDEYISRQMPIKRFSWILSHLHLNDNSAQPKKGDANFDKLFKVRPLIIHLSERFASLYKPGKNQPGD